MSPHISPPIMSISGELPPFPPLSGGNANNVNISDFFYISSLLTTSAVIFVKPFCSIELVEKLSINKLLVDAILVELSFLLVLTRMLMVGL
jgi:hypothetical protein